MTKPGRCLYLARSDPPPFPPFAPQLQIFFDLIPLRFLPTLSFGTITHYMMGLRQGTGHWLMYMAFLVLIIMISSVINLTFGMLAHNIMSGILVATIAMIHFLMLTSLFINFGKLALTRKERKGMERVGKGQDGLVVVEVRPQRSLRSTPIVLAVQRIDTNHLGVPHVVHKSTSQRPQRSLRFRLFARLVRRVDADQMAASPARGVVLQLRVRGPSAERAGQPPAQLLGGEHHLQVSSLF
jgi:hypothetical protein